MQRHTQIQTQAYPINILYSSFSFIVHPSNNAHKTTGMRDWPTPPVDWIAARSSHYTRSTGAYPPPGLQEPLVLNPPLSCHSWTEKRTTHPYRPQPHPASSP